jgi:hypothetical protein
MKIEQIEEQIESLEAKIKNASNEQENLEESRDNFIKEKIAESGKKIADKYLSQEAKKAVDEINALRQEIEDAQKTKNPKYCDKDGRIKDEIYNKKYELKKKSENLVLDELAKASDNERIIGAYYLSDIEAIYGGCSGFGYHKDPSTCGGCVAGQRIAAKLDLKKYYDFLGDRQYKISEKTKISALEKVAGINVNNELKKLKKNPEESKKNLEKIKAEKSELAKKKSAYETLKNSGMDYEEVEEKMPEFVDEIKGAGFATADIKNNVGVILAHSSNYYGSGGCEYGVNAIVFRDGKTKEEYFKYRDAYSANKDDYRYHFDKAEIVKVTKDNVTIKLTSNRKGPFSVQRTFDLSKSEKKLESILSKDEQEKFEAKYQETEKKLLNDHYLPDATMPDYIKMWGMTGTFPAGVSTGQSVPYDKPEIVEKYVNAKAGIAALVIKSQIDHCAGRGKQYAWTGYTIDKTGKIERVYDDNAYQLQLKEGKRIEVKAKDLLKEKK